MSHDPSTPRRPARTRRAVLVAALVLALGACSHNRQVPESYGDTTRNNFTEGCEEALTDSGGEGEEYSAAEATEICRCSYEGITDPDGGIPFEEFKEINDGLEDEPGPLPEVIREKISACLPEGSRS